MMNTIQNLHVKLHPAAVSYLIDKSTYGVIPIGSDLIENGRKLKGDLSSRVSSLNIKNIIIEKPFLKLQGSVDNQRKLASDIIHVQRTFGMLLYLLDSLFPNVPVVHVSSKVARNKVYSRDTISKDLQLSEVSVLLKDIKNKDYTPLFLLCLHDCLVLRSYINLQNTI